MGCCNPLGRYCGSFVSEDEEDGEGMSVQPSVTGTDDTDEDSEARNSRKTASRCWTPLPGTFVCLGLPLEGVVRLFFAIQTLYGLVVVSLHAPLLFSKGAAPRWATSKNAFHDLQDLQVGLSLRREQRWDQALLGATRVEDPSDPVLVVEVALGCALVICPLAMQVALLKRCRRRDGRARCAECAWLALTSLHILASTVLNLAKVGSVCFSSDEVARESNDRVGRLRQGESAYPQLSSDCGTLRVWFLQWTLMVALLSGMGLVACWSYFNVRLQEATRSLEAGYPRSSRRYSP